MPDENQQTRVNESVDRVEGKGSWDLYTMHYGFSGERIPMLRVLGSRRGVCVVQITKFSAKEGKMIAECDFRDGAYGPFFTTTPEHFGHGDLCRLLLRNGVGGRYKKWLKAVDEGNEALAEEYRDMAYIRFSLELTAEKEEDWTIDCTIQDPAAEKDATSEPTIEELEAEIKARREAKARTESA